MNDSTAELQKVTGRVKWYDPVKGFGFVFDEAGGSDILLHANVLRNFGQSSVAEDTIVTILAQITPRGCQAVEVLEVRPPASATDGVAEGFGGLANEEIEAILIEPARVKWFDKAKGFGFANVFGSSDDVFLHVDILRRSGLENLGPGEAVCLRVFNGDRGKMAVQVLTWDAACRV